MLNLPCWANAAADVDVASRRKYCIVQGCLVSLTFHPYVSLLVYLFFVIQLKIMLAQLVTII